MPPARGGSTRVHRLQRASQFRRGIGGSQRMSWGWTVRAIPCTALLASPKAARARDLADDILARKRPLNARPGSPTIRGSEVLFLATPSMFSSPDGLLTAPFRYPSSRRIEQMHAKAWIGLVLALATLGLGCGGGGGQHQEATTGQQGGTHA